MKEMQSLYSQNLQHMEFVGVTRDTVSDIEKTAPQLLETDEPLNRLVNEVKTGANLFETVTNNPAASEFTPLFSKLDQARDIDFRRFGRRLAFYELSADETELAAAATLQPLWQQHKNTPNLNRKQQTGATDNFLNDAGKQPYAQAIETLAMQPELTAIQNSNNKYKVAKEEGRVKAAEDVMDKAKDLRRDLNEKYSFLCNYIWTMANALPDDAAWDKLLTHINVIRKTYAELINRRRGAKSVGAPSSVNNETSEK